MTKRVTRSPAPLLSLRFATVIAIAVSTLALQLATAASVEHVLATPDLSGGIARAQIVDPCAVLSQSEVADAVGNPVLPGERQPGPAVCNWDTPERGQITVLLIWQPPGSLREPILCGEMRAGREVGGGGERLEGVAEVALWRFGTVFGLFNSGELETCGPKGYISLQLNGERDEATIKEAALRILQMVVAGT